MDNWLVNNVDNIEMDREQAWIARDKSVWQIFSIFYIYDFVKEKWEKIILFSFVGGFCCWENVFNPKLIKKNVDSKILFRKIVTKNSILNFPPEQTQIFHPKFWFDNLIYRRLPF